MPFKNATEVMATGTIPLITNLAGLQKTGKTTFALTFPRPLYYFNWDRGLLEVLKVRPELRDGVWFEDYALPADATLEDGEATLQRFIDDWREANMLSAQEAGTVVLDTAAHLKEVVQFVKLSQKMEKRIKQAEIKALADNKPFDPDLVRQERFDYGPANRLMSAILSMPSIAGSNAVFIWREKELYTSGGQATGQYAPDIWKDAPYIAQMTLERRRVGQKGNVEFLTNVLDNRFDPSTVGEYPAGVIDGYADLATLMGD